MGLPLEKEYKVLGTTMRMRQVFDASRIGTIDADAFYFIPLPRDPNATLPQDLSERLPFMLPVQTRDWYFIHTEGRTWEEHLAGLKASHAKKLRRYSRKPAKYKYTVAVEAPRKFSQDKLLACYGLLCETQVHNDDTNFCNIESFVAFMRSLSDGVLVATHADGRVLGFYSGDVIGHDHAREFRSWGVYHNLFIEHVRREFQRGAAVIDLGNTNDSFKRELGGIGETVAFELRSGRSLRSALWLVVWAIGTWMPEDHPIYRAVRRRGWGLLLPLGAGSVLALAALSALRPVLEFSWTEVLLCTFNLFLVVWLCLSKG